MDLFGDSSDEEEKQQKLLKQQKIQQKKQQKQLQRQQKQQQEQQQEKQENNGNQIQNTAKQIHNLNQEAKQKIKLNKEKQIYNGEYREVSDQKKFKAKKQWKKERKQQMAQMNPQYQKKVLDGKQQQLKNYPKTTALPIIEEEQKKSEQKHNIPYYIIIELNEKKEELGETNLEDFIDRQYKNYNNDDIDPNKIQHFPAENDEGNVEYKIQLINLSKERIIHLGTQMRYRLREGNGEAYYMIGVEDNGNPEGLTKAQMQSSLRSLCKIASQLKANLHMFPMVDGYQGKIQKVLVKQNIKETIRIDTRILMLGDTCSGKSTLLGVLLTGERDNGRGLARSRILTHQHEVLSGVTQSISHHFLVFNNEGEVINRSIFMRQGFFCEDQQNAFENLFDMSSKILTFMDIGGHKKAEKQLMTCLCSHHPDYCLLVVSALKGVSEEAEQRIKYASMFNLPFLIVITHIDECNNSENEDILDDTLDEIRQAFRKINSEKIPLVVQTEDDVDLLAKTFVKEVPIPVFLISNLDLKQYQKNYQLLERFLHKIPANEEKTSNNQKSLFLIQDVVAIKDDPDKILLDNGIVKQGTIKKGQVLYLGPDKKGNFQSAEVLDVYCKGVEVKIAQTRQMCSIKIKQSTVGNQIPINQIKKGMVCVEYNYNMKNEQPPKGSFRFEAELVLMDESQEITLKPGYQPVINTTTVRQACIIEIPRKNNQLSIGKQQSSHKKQSKSLDTKSKDIKALKSVSQESQDYVKSHFQKTKKYKKYSMSEEKLMETENNLQDQIQIDNNNINNLDNKMLQNNGQNISPKQIKQQYQQLVLQPQNSNEEDIKQNQENVILDNKYQFEKVITCKEIDMDDERIIKFEPNKKKQLILRFKYNPVYIKPNEQIMISDNTIKAIGWIRKIYY